MESEKNGVRFWLKARTIGLCAAFNRLLGYHPVRSTKPVVFLSSMFIKDSEHSNKRSDQHLAKCPDYPDPVFYLSHLGKYFFRNESLLHLRVEQFVRYLIISDRDSDDTGAGTTADEDYDEEEDADDVRFVESHHRHFDAFMEQEPPGKRYFARIRGVPSAKRREHSKLAVSRYWQPEPIGNTREAVDSYILRAERQADSASAQEKTKTYAPGLLSATASPGFGVGCRQRPHARRRGQRKAGGALDFKMGPACISGRARSSRHQLADKLGWQHRLCL